MASNTFQSPPPADPPAYVSMQDVFQAIELGGLPAALTPFAAVSKRTLYEARAQPGGPTIGARVKMMEQKYVTLESHVVGVMAMSVTCLPSKSRAPLVDRELQRFVRSMAERVRYEIEVTIIDAMETTLSYNTLGSVTFSWKLRYLVCHG